MTRILKPRNPPDMLYNTKHQRVRIALLNPLRSIIIQIRLLRSRFLRFTTFAFSIMQSLEQLRALV